MDANLDKAAGRDEPAQRDAIPDGQASSRSLAPGRAAGITRATTRMTYARRALTEP
jgi:hypothetical protein